MYRMNLYNSIIGVGIKSSLGRRYFHLSNLVLKNYYTVLDVEPSANQADIKNAYYKLSKLYHPDIAENREENIEKFRDITEAYDVLSNVISRKLYDKGASIKGKQSLKYDESGSQFYVKRETAPKSVIDHKLRMYSEGDTWVDKHYKARVNYNRYHDINEQHDRNVKEEDQSMYSQIRVFAAIFAIISLLAGLVKKNKENRYQTDRKVQESSRNQSKKKCGVTFREHDLFYSRSHISRMVNNLLEKDCK